MKFPLTITILLIFSVTFLYYLLNNSTFLPIDQLGNYNWFNIITIIFLSIILLFSLLSLLIYLGLTISKKIQNKELIVKLSVKYSLVVTLGLLVVFLLNFFNILDLLWGISILVVVLIFTFII